MDLSGLLQLSSNALNTDNEQIDPSFHLDLSIKLDTEYVTNKFCDSWVLQLDTEDSMNFGPFLCFQLKKVLFVGSMKATECAALMTGRNEQTMCEWRLKFFQNDRKVVESKQGRYQQSGILWSNENFNKKQPFLLGVILMLKEGQI